ncbi:MAG: cation:dicarboxylase symporter family transporter [Alphaproteobacteria bacterium]|nr:MAG: cation:dicarboxylase symporter family transporter [Alphaproteobacteria bacterium]
MHRVLSFMVSSSVGRIFVTLGIFMLLAPAIPHVCHRTFYTISLLIKDMLMIILPIVVVVFIASSLSLFQLKAPALILSIMLFEFVSNATAVMFAYASSAGILAQVTQLTHMPASKVSLEPWFSLGAYKPSFWSSDKALLAGALLGLLTVFWREAPWDSPLQRLRDRINALFTMTVGKLAPVFLLGFLSNMYAGGASTILGSAQLGALGLSTFVVCAYVVLLYILAGKGQIKLALKAMNNAFPSLFMSFTTMCSITTMPYTIQCAEKNMRDPSMAKMIIPATTNIQQAGDCLMNALFCLILLKTYGMPIPGLWEWSIFVGVFATARFATAGVMGGAIFIMLPLYEKYLGFTAEMSAILLALNVLFDPIITAMNVYANGALCIIFERFWLCLEGGYDALRKRLIAS